MGFVFVVFFLQTQDSFLGSHGHTAFVMVLLSSISRCRYLQLGFFLSNITTLKKVLASLLQILPLLLFVFNCLDEPFSELTGGLTDELLVTPYLHLIVLTIIFNTSLVSHWPVFSCLHVSHFGIL